ncbi:hypothetical protein [Paraflavitalea speifideaquila]|uniref:hypothetical protein n=1 Tax=Paraflavitalea speifideaquila TaxID=3076558 RepID=UPI0028E3013D|nr:hypothetical protein [Paraflavitalea speifideiaquila]
MTVFDLLADWLDGDQGNGGIRQKGKEATRQQGNEGGVNGQTPNFPPDSYRGFRAFGLSVFPSSGLPDFQPPVLKNTGIHPFIRSLVIFTS